MDCRMTLLLALGLIMGGVGCAATNQSIKPAPAPAPAAAASAAALEAKAPQGKRPPQPATCVAFAACRERQAEKEGIGPALKQTLYDQAGEAYRQAIKIDPEHMPAYFGLARIYMAQNQQAKALEVYHQALQKKPLEASLWHEIGMCHCRAKQWELAIRSLEKALELDKDNRRLTQSLGFCQARAGLAKDSLDTLAKVMTPAEANYHVARMMRHMHCDDLCRQHLQEALRLDANLAAARTMLEALDSGASKPPDAASPATAHIGFSE